MPKLPKIASRRVFTYDGQDFNSKDEVKSFIAKKELRTSITERVGSTPLPPALAAVDQTVLIDFLVDFNSVSAAKKTRRKRKAAEGSEPSTTPAAETKRGKPGPKPGSKRGKPGPKPGSKRGSKAAGGGVSLPPPPAV